MHRRTDNIMANKKKRKKKETNNELRNITQKTKDRAKRTPTDELRCSGKVNICVQTYDVVC
jgi:hypothetical protein